MSGGADLPAPEELQRAGFDMDREARRLGWVLGCGSAAAMVAVFVPGVLVGALGGVGAWLTR